jgi:hypothetical protein
MAQQKYNETVKQVAHGFTVGTPIRWNGGTWVASQANNTANADVDAYVAEVLSTSLFNITEGGLISGLAGLTPGTTYFLSETTAGAYTSTEPLPPYVSVPLFKAKTSTKAQFALLRGLALSSTPTSTGMPSQVGQAGQFLTTDGSNLLWGAAGASTLTVQTTTAATYTLLTSDDALLVDAATSTITIPVSTKKIYHVKKIASGAGTITIQPSSGQIMDYGAFGASASITSQGESLDILSDGGNLFVI